MAQPNFLAIANHIQGIRNEFVKISKMPSVPAIADQNGLQQQIEANHMEMTTSMKEI